MYLRTVVFCLLNCLGNKKRKKGVSGVEQRKLLDGPGISAGIS